jgi:hypothetical protein
MNNNDTLRVPVESIAGEVLCHVDVPLRLANLIAKLSVECKNIHPVLSPTTIAIEGGEARLVSMTLSVSPKPSLQ